MAEKSVCPKCDNTTFESGTLKTKGHQYLMLITRCDACGCVVGVTEGINTSSRVIKLAKALNINVED